MQEQTDNKNDVPQPAKSETGAQLIGRPDVQTLFIDKFILTKRPDDNILFNGIQFIPGLELEQLRFIISMTHAKRLVETLSRYINFYPEKPSAPKEEKTVSIEEKLAKTEDKAAPVPEEKTALPKAESIEKKAEVSNAPEKPAVQKLIVKKPVRKAKEKKSSSK